MAAMLMVVGSACTAAAKEAPPSSPQAAPKPTTKFTTVPKGCELLDPDTIAKYAPAATCKPGLQDQSQTHNGDLEAILERGPRWAPYDVSRQGKFAGVIDVDLKLNLDKYAENQDAASSSTSGSGSSNRPVAGIGDKAHLYYRAGAESENNRTITTGVLVSSWGNASMRIIYWHYQPAATDNGAGLSEQKMAKTLIAITRDVYDDLS